MMRDLAWGVGALIALAGIASVVIPLGICWSHCPRCGKGRRGAIENSEKTFNSLRRI